MVLNDIIQQYRQLEQALAQLQLSARFDPGVNLRLERITHLLQVLGNPHHHFPAIHIGGTSGKGTTAAMAAAMLTAAGYRTGLYLSPALQILNECYQLNGRIVATSRLSALFAMLKPALDEVAATNPAGSPTPFEAQVALAFLLFQQAGVAVAVIEVGLGGARDATNVLPAGVAVLTNVGLDHTAILGNTVAAIAQEKAGIIKPGRHVISGVAQPEARRIIAERCAMQGAQLWQVGPDITWQSEATGTFTLHLPTRTLTGLAPGMLDNTYSANAACAVAAVEALPGFILSEQALRHGLATARLPGRMEIVQEAPTVLLDGAHNPDKLRTALQVIDTTYADKRRILLPALKADKDAHALLPPLLERVDQVIVTAFRAKHRWEPLEPQALADLAAMHAPQLNIRIVPDPLEAISLALDIATPTDLVWVTGSLYLVGDVREHWYPAARMLAAAEEG
jgi:dihydrofolate synthase / folylpolyglutamate synthase